MTWKEWHNVANNEALWLDHTERGLLKAEYVRDYILRLWFDDEEGQSVYELDFYPLFVVDNPGGVFDALKNKERFRLVTGDYSLLWLNPDTGNYDERSIDLAPECVRYFCEKYGKRLNLQFDSLSANMMAKTH